MRGLLGAAGLLALKGCAAPTREAEAAAVAQALAGGVSWIPTLYGPTGAPAPGTLSTSYGAVGDVVMVAGRNRADDGAGGLFVWIAAAAPPEDASAGGLTVSPVPPPGSPVGHWRRVYRGAVNVAWLGAGLATPSDPAADTAAFERALRDRGAAVYVPRGQYTILRPLALPYGVHLSGDGEGTAITFAPPVDEVDRGCLDGQYNPIAGAADGVVEHLRLLAADARAFVGIRLFGAFRFTIRNVYVDGRSVGFGRGGIRISGADVINSAAIHITGCHIQRCVAPASVPDKRIVGSAIVLDGASPGGVTVDGGSRLQENEGWGIQSVLDPLGTQAIPASLVVCDTVIEGNGGGIGGSLGPCVVRGCHFEAHSRAPHIDVSTLATSVSGLTGAVVRGLSVEGNKFVSPEGTFRDCHIRIAPTSLGSGGIVVRSNFSSGATVAMGMVGIVEGVVWGPNVSVDADAIVPAWGGFHGLQLVTSLGAVPSQATRFVTASFTCTAVDQILLVAGAANPVVTLPTAAENLAGGRTLTIKRIDAPGASGSVTVQAAAGMQIQGAASLTLAPLESVTLVHSGWARPAGVPDQWYVLQRGVA